MSLTPKVSRWEAAHEPIHRRPIHGLHRHRLGRCKQRSVSNASSLAYRTRLTTSSNGPSHCDVVLADPSRLPWNWHRARSSMRYRSMTSWCSFRSIHPPWRSTVKPLRPAGPRTIQPMPSWRWIAAIGAAKCRAAGAGHPGGTTSRPGQRPGADHQPTAQHDRQSCAASHQNCKPDFYQFS